MTCPRAAEGPLSSATGSRFRLPSCVASLTASPDELLTALSGDSARAGHRRCLSHGRLRGPIRLESARMIAPSLHKDGYVCSLHWVPFESPSMAGDRPNRVRTVGEAACRAHGARVSMSSGAEGSTASGADAGRRIGCRDPAAGFGWSIFPSTWVHGEPEPLHRNHFRHRGD